MNQNWQRLIKKNSLHIGNKLILLKCQRDRLLPRDKPLMTDT